MHHDVIFEAAARTRVKRRMWGIATYYKGDRYQALWWDYEKRAWVESTRGRKGSSSHAPCRSYKAFLRHLKKHGETLRDYEVVLVSPYRGCDVIAKPKGGNDAD